MIGIEEDDGIEYILEGMSSDTLDITDRVFVYRNGKTFECDCGQGFGVEYGTIYVNCPTCGVVVYDTMAGDREPPKVSEGQTTIGDWG